MNITVPLLAPTLEISFTVYGTPRPQGSTRAFMKPGMRFPVVTSDNRALKPWRQEITASAIALKVLPFEKDIPVEITLNFYFTRPKSAKNRKGMTVRPDGDKLIRACLDSIKGVLIHDDAQVVELHARKHYGGPERVTVEIRKAIV